MVSHCSSVSWCVPRASVEPFTCSLCCFLPTTLDPMLRFGSISEHLSTILFWLFVLQRLSSGMRIESSRFDLTCSSSVRVGKLRTLAQFRSPKTARKIPRYYDMSWMYAILSVQGVSNLIGAIEIALAVLLALRPFSAKASFAGSLGSIVTFLLTTSFFSRRQAPCS